MSRSRERLSRHEEWNAKPVGFVCYGGAAQGLLVTLVQIIASITAINVGARATMALMATGGILLALWHDITLSWLL